MDWKPAHYRHSDLTGWLCPRCGRANSPLVMECFCNEILTKKKKKVEKEKGETVDGDNQGR